MRIAIIGGTGVYDPNILTNIREETISTSYGDVTLKVGTYKGEEVAFLARHGSGHSIPPHKINYRANIMALKKAGVERVIATSAVGSLNRRMKPGQFVILDQFLDFTKNRTYTYFDGGDMGVVHIDYTDPYCPEVSTTVYEAAKELGIEAHHGGCYVCTEGPRYETAAEIKMFERLGGDLVGMTNVPEVILAREAGLCYGVIAMVTNWAAGISPTPLTHEEVTDVMNSNAGNLRALVMRSIETMPERRGCKCKDAGRALSKF